MKVLEYQTEWGGEERFCKNAVEDLNGQRMKGCCVEIYVVEFD
jgi:hypothetical protein